MLLDLISFSCTIGSFDEIETRNALIEQLITSNQRKSIILAVLLISNSPHSTIMSFHCGCIQLLKQTHPTNHDTKKQWFNNMFGFLKSTNQTLLTTSLASCFQMYEQTIHSNQTGTLKNDDIRVSILGYLCFIIQLEPSFLPLLLDAIIPTQSGESVARILSVEMDNWSRFFNKKGYEKTNIVDP
jgi:hypothetical protein